MVSLQLGTYRTENGAVGHILSHGNGRYSFSAMTRRGNLQATLVTCGATPTGRTMFEMRGHPLGGILTDHSDEHALFEFAAAGDPKPRAIWKFQAPMASASDAVNVPQTMLCQAQQQYLQHPRWSDPLCTRRRQVLMETVESFMKNKNNFLNCAQSNLDRWRADASEHTVNSSKPVLVFERDWGEVTMEMTQRFGQRFAVLNMANQQFAGGFYLLGEFAQEEDMFRRTDCHFHVTSEECDMHTGCYLPQVQSLINGSTGRVALDTCSPRVCIRGREDRQRPDLGFQWLSRPSIRFL